MATTLLGTFKPEVVDLPPDVDPNALAWFAVWSSGHLSHAHQWLLSYAATAGLPLDTIRMGWSEYQRLEAEAHWYQR